MYLNFKTEYTHGAVFAPLEKVVKKAATMADYAGIADMGNTYGHVSWNKACKKHNIKPIFGVQLPVVEDLELKERSFPHNWMIFIAKNNEGLVELYSLVDKSHKQFYWLPRLSREQKNQITQNILILNSTGIGRIDNYYVDVEDKAAYEAFTDEFKLERKTGIMHVPTKKEWLADTGINPVDLCVVDRLADDCNATLPSAPMVKYKIEDEFSTLSMLCRKGAHEKGFDLVTATRYKDRFHKELKVIKEKNFQDYFLVVADLVRYAKTKMLVGPARGSAAGSLVCYLLGITEVDPIKYDLLFERFIDLNRADLPDIDIDFPDDKRHLVLKYLEKKYGKDNVAQIANIGRLKPKSALNRAAKNLCIPLDEIEEIKGIASSLKDTFENSDIGKAFIEKYPAMKVSADLEGHTSYIGKHAAGVLVCNEPVHKYCGINSRDKGRLAMIDKRDAETLGLLKIDVLGLRTLSIIAEVCDSIGKPYEWIYGLPTDDLGAYKVFEEHRFSGIFQFEGDSVSPLAKKMPMETLEDLAVLTAIARPGPLESGAAWDYVNARSGRKDIKWISDHPLMKEATKETYGVIVYEEQVMRVVREVGGFPWKDVNGVRKIIKKKTSDLDKFEEQFLKGAMRKGVKDASNIWDQLKTMGGYVFNKSHAISYGHMSYYCAYLKAHYPLEFTKACLNHSKDDNSALKILRDAVENDGVRYNYINKELSVQKWSVDYDTTAKCLGEGSYEEVSCNTLLGGFLSIHGIGPANANKIVKLRKEGKPFPSGIQKNLDADISPFKYLYPAREIYGDYYSEHEKFGINNPVITIKEVKENNGKFNFIGKLVELKSRDLNEAEFVTKRSGAYKKGQTAYLIFTLEDDTDSIRCKIKAKNYLSLGKEIAEHGKVDADWYVVCGLRMENWDIIFVENIRRITR